MAWKTRKDGRKFPLKGKYEIMVCGRPVEMAQNEDEAMEAAANYPNAEIFCNGKKVAYLTKGATEMRIG